MNIPAIEETGIVKLRAMTAELNSKESEKEGWYKYVESVLGNARIPILSIDSERTIVYANDAAEKLFGCTEGQELEGKQAEDFLPERIFGMFEKSDIPKCRVNCKTLAGIVFHATARVGAFCNGTPNLSIVLESEGTQDGDNKETSIIG